MRILGIDYGTKRVGVAISDPEGRMAFPLATYPNNDALLKEIGGLCVKKEVELLVVGMSHDLDGTPNRVQRDIDVFVEELRAVVPVPIHLELERFSTQAALRIQGRTAQTDASAAALILESYLARQRG